MKYLLKYCGGLLLLLLLFSSFSSCRKEPTFDKVPNIEFRRYELTDAVDQLGNKVKNLGIVIYFQDGDGNLGLSTSMPIDTIAPFNRHPFNYNFHLKLFTKQTQPGGSSEFVQFQFPQTGFEPNGKFPRISSDNREEPLEGEIKYTLTLPIDIWQQVVNKTVKFEVFIYDRTLPVPNKSNVILTDELLLKP